MARLKMNAKWLERVTTVETQTDYWDLLTPGLVLRVGRGGTKAWSVRYRLNGHHKRLKIGVYPRLDLATARQKARAALALADSGEDPAQEEEAPEASETTFAALAAEVLAKRARKGRDGRPTAERTQHERRRLLDVEILPSWGEREASEITRRDVVNLVTAIAERGSPVAANHTLALIRLVFNDGLRVGFPTLEGNPSHMVEPPGVEQRRDRWLSGDEIRAVWMATVPENPLTRAVFRLALLTGQRVGSVCAMRWDKIETNGSGATWTTPPEDHKSRREHLTPLSAEALAVIEELRGVRSDQQWVFPSRAGTRTGHLSNMGGSLARIRKRSKLKRWTVHDFRRTIRTHMTRGQEDGGLGVAPHVADAVLGHAEASLGWTRYTGDRPHYLLAEKREALRKWGAFVAKCVK